MNYSNLTKEQLDEYSELMFTRLNSESELKNWISVFLDMDIPSETIMENSTSNPLNAIWKIYNAFLNNKSGEESPAGYILMSARESMKTVSVAIVELLLLLHFELEQAHAASIESQSSIGLGYITSFLSKVEPLMTHAGWINESANKRTLSFTAPSGKKPYIKILIATSKGFNSIHTNVLCVHKGDDILIKNPISGQQRNRVGKTAKQVFEMFKNGKKPIAITFNHKTGAIEEKPIIAAWESRKDLLKITCSDDKFIRVSPEHKVYVKNKGYIEAKDLQVGDELLKLNKFKSFNRGKYFEKIDIEPLIAPDDGWVEQVLIGSLLGDGGCYKKLKNNAYFVEQHCPAQAEYVRWKKSILETEFKVREMVGYSGYRDTWDMVKIMTGCNPILNPYSTFKKTLYNVEKLDARGLAIWFMDDGSGGQHSLFINSQSFTKEQNEKLAEILINKFQLDVRVEKYNKNDEIYWSIVGGINSLYRLYKLCENYWHPTMLYKFDVGLKGHTGICRICNESFVREGGIENTTKHCSKSECRVIDKGHLKPIRIIKIETHRKWGTVDFTVEDNNNFFVNNTLVHNCIDELDLADPAALKEAKGIISHSRDIYGKTVYLSTRKYAFGLMSQVIEKKDELNYELLAWNVLDVAEACPASRHLPSEPKVTRYVANNLPLQQITEEQYNFLADAEKNKFTKLENTFSGCTKCTLLPVCKGKLATKAPECSGGFWKPIGSIKSKFAEYDPETAEAQLLCMRPGSTGLVYPRLVTIPSIESTNVITLNEAYFALTNNNTNNITEEMVLTELKKQETEINAGVDFGFTHSSAIGIFAFPQGEQWMIDTFAAPNLEFSELLEIALKYQQRYEPSKWWCDGARPEFVATFNKHGLRSPKFNKDVIGGISAVRAKIIDGVGKRRFKILLTESNKKAILALSKHKFILDALGEPTDRPDDEPHIADIADMVRMVFQNKCPVKGAGKIHHTVAEPKNTAEQVAQTTNNSFLKAVQEATGVAVGAKGPISTKKKGGFYFSW